MKKVALFTVAYNCEKWIYPYLSIYKDVDKRIVLLGKQPLKEYAEHHSPVPDRTEALIRKHFPDVEIVWQNGKNFPEVANQGLDCLRDYDFVISFSTDELMLPNDWAKILDRARNVEMDALQYDFGNNSILYYNDIDHGIKLDYEWIETRGIDTKHDYQGYMAYIGRGYVANDITVHHYTGMKGAGMSEEELAKHKIYTTPPELRELFEEGWRLLEKL